MEQSPKRGIPMDGYYGFNPLKIYYTNMFRNLLIA
jgi:hypothetical protein